MRADQGDVVAVVTWSGYDEHVNVAVFSSEVKARDWLNAEHKRAVEAHRRRLNYDVELFVLDRPQEGRLNP